MKYHCFISAIGLFTALSANAQIELRHLWKDSIQAAGFAGCGTPYVHGDNFLLIMRKNFFWNVKFGIPINIRYK